ncbi:MAG: hypothetical protein ACT6U0_16030, partial [Shinella sp.]
YIDDPNEGWVLTADGSITVADGHGIVNNDAFNDSVITVAGDIVADGMYKSGIFSNGPSAILKVDAGGTIHAYSGIAMYGEGSSAENFGHITAENLGIYANADNADVFNAGAITANVGVYFENTASMFSIFRNAGTITADRGFVAKNGGAYLKLDATSIIDATSIGIELDANSASANVIVNEGLIKSADIAIQGKSGHDRIENYGTIKGKIVLGEGNDSFDNRGGTVDHAVDGGGGDDIYIFGDTEFKIIDSGGNDTVGTGVTYTLAADNNIENLYLVGSKNIDGTGNAFVNTITGNYGNNVLYGGNDAVIDTLRGDRGNDTYILGSGHDVVLEGGKMEFPGTTESGVDTITSTISRSLAKYDFVENLKLLGSSNIDGTGGNYANVIIGNSGNNILNGGVELEEAIDTLSGGAGNDTYVLGSGHDKVADSAGIDTITSSIGRSLTSYSTIENLTLTGNGNINAVGNGLANVLTGNAGTNTLNGGAGNDTYVLGSGADKVIDASGIDTITSLISRNLSTFATIENLKLLGVANISATGNALSNTLTGNSGVNTLSGGAGNDLLIGGAGADKLNGGPNTDTASYAGATAGVVANLAAALANAGDAKGDTYVSIENLIGSSHNDTLTGNNGINTLYGGAGGDKMTGGTGADIFLFKASTDTTVATAGRDSIFDFNHAQGDRISLSGIDANTVLAGDQPFLFKGTAAFSGAKGELHFEMQASDTYVSGDTNGDKKADFVIHFDDAIAFQAGDFIL